MEMYKGFTKDMKCRDFQYKEGETYEEDVAVLCDTGFHACEDPIDCLSYYPPGSSVYHKVDLDGVAPSKSDDSKRVGTKIRIGARISLMDIISAHFAYVKENCTKAIEAGEAKAVTAGAHECATAGYRGAATAGDSGAATAGYSGAATAGYRGAATAGDRGAATAGYRGAATAGDRGAATAGDSGAATAGDSGAATAGAFGRANGGGSASVGKHGVAIVKNDTRFETPKVKGGIGAVLVIAEENNDNYDIKRWKAERVDGKRIKADTWYMLGEDGEFTEATNNGEDRG